jgi:hypothetical protein
MPDDWAKKYVAEYTRTREVKRRRNEESQRRREYAEAGADSKFRQIRERIAQDVQTLAAAVPFHPVEVSGDGRAFTVISPGTPQAALTVSLTGTRVGCAYRFSPQDGAGDKERQDSKTLRLSADMAGRLTVYEEGGGKAFAYDSEVSEFLLKPLLDHVTS